MAKKLIINVKRQRGLETKAWEIRYEYIHKCPPHIWSFADRHWACIFCPLIQHEKPDAGFITKDEVEFVITEH